MSAVAPAVHHHCTCGALTQPPPQLVSETDNWTRMLVKEMIAHKHAFERARDSQQGCHELDNFWLRKSKQPVLSVLMVKKKNKGVRFFRGINAEVSMPTGSLCSERNAIGSALSTDPSLCRKDLRMIAVLALGLEPFSTTSTLSAHMPVPPRLIPLAPTTPHYLELSPAKGAKSPATAVAFPSLRGAGGDVDMGEEDEQKLPASAAAAGTIARAHSERSVYQNGNHTQLQPHAPPSSPHTKSLTAASTADVSSGATPRKRKAGTATAAISVPSPSPEPASSVTFATSPAHALSPPTHSPRLTRHSTQPTSTTAGTPQQTSSAKSSRPPSPAISVPPPMSPMRHTRSMRSSSNGSITPVQDGLLTPRAAKRARRGESKADNGVSDSQFADGVVTEEQTAAYVAHELALVAHRDALLSASYNARLLSGNDAANATHTPPPAAASGSAAAYLPSASPPTISLEHMQRIAESKSAPLPFAGVVDERNPINPCGACNEWLKKIAESNPDFRVVTFTSTDCSTCYVKPVSSAY